MCGEANQIYTSDWRNLLCRTTAIACSGFSILKRKLIIPHSGKHQSAGRKTAIRGKENANPYKERNNSRKERNNSRKERTSCII